MSTMWKACEVATCLLDRFAAKFGLNAVQGKQVVAGTCTDWEIDAKGNEAQIKLCR